MLLLSLRTPGAAAPLRRSLALMVIALQALSGVSLASPRLERLSTTAGTAPASQAASTSPVHVNRTRPAVAPPSDVPVFSAVPTVAEVRRARVFAEALVPVGGTPSDEETAALARAITAYRAANDVHDVVPFGAFLQAYPTSPWRPALEANLATLFWHEGAFTRAFTMWDRAWQRAKHVDTAEGRAVAAIAMAGGLEAAVAMGRRGELEARLRAWGDRTVGGSAGATIQAAQRALSLFERDPDNVIPSGSQAVAVLAAAAEGRRPSLVRPRADGRAGQSLRTVQQLAQAAGLPLVARIKPPQDPLPVPSIVHLQIGHFTGVVARTQDRYLVRDPALGGDRWLPAAVLEEEISGFVLVPSTAAIDWATPTDEDASTVVGFSCQPGAGGPAQPGPCPGSATPASSAPGAGGSTVGAGEDACMSPGMPTYTFKPENASLFMVDTPIRYSPARGPAVHFTFTYDQRYAGQPQVPVYGHVGPQWQLNWTSYIREVPLWINPGWNNEYIPAHVEVHLRGGGEQRFFGTGTGSFGQHWNGRAELVQVSSSPIRYERRLSDGTIEVFSVADTAPAGQRRIFLSEVRDPLGASVTLTYDSALRLVSVTDALGQVTTLTYTDASDPLRLTAITDPFGRGASLTYHPGGQLASLTDALGLTSSFAYDTTDFLTTLATPYGTSTFRRGWGDTAYESAIEATDAFGGTRRLEYRALHPTLSATVPSADVPDGFGPWNTDLNKYVTLSWDERGWKAGPGDPATATVTKWFLANWEAGFYSQAQTTRVPQSVQQPGVARVWYAYPGQDRTRPTSDIGTSTVASVEARVLDDGTTQARQTTVNSHDQVIERIDPLGRRTSYTYAANGVDLLEVRQTTGTANDLVAAYTNYTASHQPQSVTDAAGQTTTLTYTATGQVATVTNALQETTTYTYDTDGRLTSVTGPVTGATATYTYDTYGRPRTSTQDGVTITTDYDLFDRPTSVWYPDGTREILTYDRLDLATWTDRLGRETRYITDGLRRRVATRDPAGRTIRQVFTEDRDQLVDANGQATTWERDLLGRVTREVRADGVTATVYTYQPRSGRLATVTDPKGQVTTYTYAHDDALLGMTFSNAAIATPGVNYTYEAVYGRTATMLDGIGTTTYMYHPAGQVGAGQVATVDGPLTDDTIAYTYDALGRVVQRTINGAANSLTYAYDALGRVTTETNVLGAFTYGYDGTSGRLASVTYPNGQTSAYAYLPATQEHKLQTIHHQLPGATTLSRFDYTYDAVGNIVTWQQQAGTADPELWRYRYDRADQLLGATVTSTGTTPTVLKRYAYGYDPAGNRLFEQVDDGVTAWTYDELNRLQLQAGGGVLQVEGLVNEPAYVRIQGQAAAVTAAGHFQGGLPVTPGTNVFTVEATDGSGNTATAEYEVDVTNAPKTFSYDANGNLTSDGTRSLEWDARNQLVAVTIGTNRSEFVYDGLQRRVRMIEKAGGVTTSDTRVIWCDTAICEERAPDGTAVIRRAFGRGELAAGQTRLIATDHLGSVVGVTDTVGGLLARYAFDPWGERTLIDGSDVTTVSFTGHRAHDSSGLTLALYRGYDAGLARWVSSDPIKFDGGLNFYSYVDNQSIVQVDMLGLVPSDKRYGLPDQFWEWYHRQQKKKGDADLTKEQARRAFEQWKRQGEPGPDSKSKHRTRGGGRGGAGWGPRMSMLIAISPCILDPMRWGINPSTGECSPKVLVCTEG